MVAAGYGSCDGTTTAAATIAIDDDGVVRGGGLLFWLNDSVNAAEEE